MTARRWIAAGLGAALALGSPAGAQERPKAKQQEGVVEQPRAKPKPKPTATSAIASPIPRGAAVGGLPADPLVAPRMGGLQDQRFGGASCRTACSSNYIFCQQQDDITSCSASWARCLSACPPISSSE